MQYKEFIIHNDTKFILGLHPKPQTHQDSDRNDWYWVEDSDWEDNRFLPKAMGLIQENHE